MYIAARVDELTLFTPEVLDNFELALREIDHGRTSHADIDVVKLPQKRRLPIDSLTRRLTRFRVSGIVFNPQDWVDFSYNLISANTYCPPFVREPRTTSPKNYRLRQHSGACFHWTVTAVLGFSHDRFSNDMEQVRVPRSTFERRSAGFRLTPIFPSNPPAAFRRTPGDLPWHPRSASPCFEGRTRSAGPAPGSSRCPYRSLPLYSAAPAARL